MDGLRGRRHAVPPAQRWGAIVQRGVERGPDTADVRAAAAERVNKLRNIVCFWCVFGPAVRRSGLQPAFRQHFYLVAFW